MKIEEALEQPQGWVYKVGPVTYVNVDKASFHNALDCLGRDNYASFKARLGGLQKMVGNDYDVFSLMCELSEGLLLSFADVYKSMSKSVVKFTSAIDTQIQSKIAEEEFGELLYVIRNDQLVCTDRPSLEMQLNKDANTRQVSFNLQDLMQGKLPQAQQPSGPVEKRDIDKKLYV